VAAAFATSAAAAAAVVLLLLSLPLLHMTSKSRHSHSPTCRQTHKTRHIRIAYHYVCNALEYLQAIFNLLVAGHIQFAGGWPHPVHTC
jgi:hypothetical protein